MKRVVVLGGSGFLGRHICEAFAHRDWEVLSLSRRRPGPAGVRSLTLRTTAGTRSALAEVLGAERPQAVVNAAGAVWRATEEEMTTSNVALVGELLEAVRTVGAGPRLVHLGSVHEHALPAPAAAARPEPAPAATPYARTKGLATEAVLAATATGAVDGVIIRVANALGAGAPPGSLFGDIAGRLAAARRRGERCVLDLPPLDARRDFIDVRDVADAVVRAATADVVGAVLDVGRGETARVGDLVTDLISVSEVPTTVVPRAAGSAGTANRGHGTEYKEVANTAARLSLDWHPRYTLRESLTAMWRAAAG